VSKSAREEVLDDLRAMREKLIQAGMVRPEELIRKAQDLLHVAGEHGALQAAAMLILAAEADRLERG
jgi:hypothetical protein